MLVIRTILSIQLRASSEKLPNVSFAQQPVCRDVLSIDSIILKAKCNE